MKTTEKKVSHTPGPWFQSHLEDKTDGMYYTRVYDHKDIIATLHWYPVDLGDGVTGSRREANAKLIAAAPELLAALKDVMYDIDGNNAYPIERGSLLDRVIRNAISKATE